MQSSGAAVLAALLAVAACERSMAVPPSTEQMTADCAAPSYATDMLVCHDPDLLALDVELATLWSQVSSGPGGGPAATAAQAAWFRERSLCAFEEDHRGCVDVAYRARIEALRRGSALP